MKNITRLIYIFLIVPVFSNYVFSQEKNTISPTTVIYEARFEDAPSDTHISSDDDLIKSRVNQLAAKNNAAINGILYELHYDSSKSLYQIVKNLEVDQDFTYRNAVTLSGGGSRWYRDTEKDLYLRQAEGLGELFLIEESFKYDWKLTKESKEILGMTCYKATAQKESTSIFGHKQSSTAIVWYTPEINVPFGPKGLDGLPGLVLEGSSNGRVFLKAVRIKTDSKEAEKKLKQPKKGIKMKEEEFDKIILKKAKEFLKQ